MRRRITASSHQAPESPFIPVARIWRVLIISYVLVYEILTPVMDIMLHGAQGPSPGARLATHALYQVAILLPFIFYRRSFGWVHPLILPTAFAIASTVSRDPVALLEPIQVLSTSLQPVLFHGHLPFMSAEALADAEVKGNLLLTLSLLVYYAAFFVHSNIKSFELRLHRPTGIRWKSIMLVSLSVFVATVLIQSRGGLSQHFIDLAYGRHRALGGMGHVTIFTRLGLLACYLWYAVDKEAFRKPPFIICAVISLSLGFIVSGSRGSVIIGFCTFLIIWVLHHRKTPILRAGLIAVVAFFLVGVLGMLRSSGTEGEVDTTVITEFDLQETAESTQHEVEQIAQASGYTGVMTTVPDRIDYLRGESYIGMALFFVPRAVWPEKPRGIGGIYGERIAGRSPGGGAVPVNATGEAYWNFGIYGVVVVFWIFGLLHALAANWFKKNAREPTAWVPYVLFLTEFIPGSRGAIPFFQTLFCLLMIYLFFRVVRVQ